MRGRWAAVRVGAPLIVACACSPRALTPAFDAVSDGGATSVVAPPAMCPPADEVAPVDAPPTSVASAPTRLPFSCQPMPAAFFFPPPSADVSGRFSRCASFDVGAVKQLAVSRDGRLVALAPADGIVRVVEVASRQVIAVLAPPRATIDFVAFEPSGRGVLTLASGEREVTLWRALDWTPVWTVSLPGHRYQRRFGGGVAFAPDGREAVASPGDSTFVLDVAAGAVRATRPGGTVLDVAYGWGGRRVVVAEASLAAHCVHAPNGGTVTVLDAVTLAEVAQVADLGGYGNPGGDRGRPAFRASPVDDLVLVVPTVDEPSGPHAFRLSDGGALPAPGFNALPAAFMPDGGSVLVSEGGALERIRVADGTTVSVTALGGSGPLAVSGDGKVVAIGGSGAELLRVWNTNDVVAATVCAGEAPTTPGYGERPAAISQDGQVLALSAGTGVRVLRRADGAPIAILPTPGSPTLSPSGQLVVAAPASPNLPAIVSRVGDAAPLVALPGDEWSWANFVFSPRENRLYSNGFRLGRYGFAVVDLPGPAAATSVVDLPLYSALIGVSNGCPVLYQGERGAWRSCGGCDDPPFLPGATAYNGAGDGTAALSADGRFVAIGRGAVRGAGVTVGEMPPASRTLATIGQRADEVVWAAQEYPIAVAPNGRRILTGAAPAMTCYWGPEFEAHLHDGATGELLDALPPGPVVADGALRTLAYGAQLWCAR